MVLGCFLRVSSFVCIFRGGITFSEGFSGRFDVFGFGFFEWGFYFENRRFEIV